MNSLETSGKQSLRRTVTLHSNHHLEDVVMVEDEVVVAAVMVAVEVAETRITTAVVMVVEAAAAVLAREPGKTRIRPAERTTIESEVMTRRWLAPAGLLERHRGHQGNSMM